MSFFDKLACANASVIGGSSFLKIGSQISSNLVLVIEKSKSFDYANPRIVNLASVSLDSNSLTFLHFSRNLLRAFLSFDKSIIVFSLNSWTQYSTNYVSKSCPPKWVSPLVDFTSLQPSPMQSTVTSKVPPPKSNTRMFLSSTVLFSMSNAKLAAVGSFMILRTLRPAILPAS